MAPELLPPQNLEAERAVLGSVLIEPETLPAVYGISPPEAFYRETHQRIYRAMLELVRQHHPLDLLTLAAALGSELEAVGGLAYLAQLGEATPTSAHAEHYAGLVREAWLRRRMLQAAGHIVQLARDRDQDLDQVLSAAEAAMLEVAATSVHAAPVRLGEVAIEQLNLQAGGAGTGSRLQSGLAGVDTALGVVSAGDLVVLAARPGVGKTALALQIAYHLAQLHQPVLVVSLEMGARQLADRLAVMQTGIEAQALKRRQLSEGQLEQLSRWASQLAARPLLVDASAQLTTLELRSRARRVKAKHGLDLVVVDYLQLLDVPDKRRMNRQEQVAEISRSLKAMALELQVPVLALSQLSREAERQDDRRPQLWNLRESGAIEQDADLVAFLHRPEKNPQGGAIKTELLVEKSRHGARGSCWLMFVPPRVRFEAWSEREGGEHGSGRAPARGADKDDHAADDGDCRSRRLRRSAERALRVGDGGAIEP